MAKKTIPLGQFTFGEISPQAAQSLSPKESPYALREARNVHVDVLSGVKSRYGTEWIQDFVPNEDPVWSTAPWKYPLDIRETAKHGMMVKVVGKYLLVQESDRVYIYERIGGEWEYVQHYEVISKIFDVYKTTFAYAVIDPAGITDPVVHVYELTDSGPVSKGTLTTTSCKAISVYEGEVAVLVSDRSLLIYSYNAQAVEWEISQDLDPEDITGSSINLGSKLLYRGNYMSIEYDLSNDPIRRRYYIYKKSGSWSFVDYKTVSVQSGKAEDWVDLNDSGYFAIGVSNTNNDTGMYAFLDISTNTSLFGTGSEEGHRFACAGYMDPLLPELYYMIGSTGEIYKVTYSGGALGAPELVMDFPVPSYTFESEVSSKYFRSGGSGFEGIGTSGVILWMVQLGMNAGVMYAAAGEAYLGTEVAYAKYNYSSKNSFVISQLFLYDSQGGLIQNSGNPTDPNGLPVTSYDYNGLDTWIPATLSFEIDMSQSGVSIYMSDTYRIYGDSLRRSGKILTGAVLTSEFGIPKPDAQLLSLSHPDGYNSAIYIADQTSIRHIYGGNQLSEKLSAVGGTCRYKDYSQWGDYFFFIDETQTDVFIGKITDADNFQTLAAFLTGQDPPSWGTDIPRSLDFHEGRFLFVSKKRYTGSALEQQNANGLPFTFPDKEITSGGDTVYTPATSFHYFPLGGDDPGFLWIKSGRFVLAGSVKDVWILSDYDGSVSAQAPNMHKISSLGSADIKGVQTGGALYYFLGDKITMMGLAMGQDGPISIPINNASKHFFKTYKPVKMVLTSGVESRLWILRDDGKLISYQINNQTQLNGDGAWALHDFGGTISDITPFETVDESTLMMLITRNLPEGGTITTIEKISEKLVCLDSYGYVEVGSDYTSPRFANASVYVKHRDGADWYTGDDDGLVAFGETLYEAYIGFPFDAHFIPRVFPDIHGKEKGRIVSISPVVEDTRVFYYGENIDSLREYTIMDDGLYTGQVDTLNISGGFEYLPGFTIKAYPGEYLEINAIYVEVET
jgi:hypothetical protein